MENNSNQNLSEVGVQVVIKIWPDAYDKIRYTCYKHHTTAAEIIRNLIDQLPDERPHATE